MPDDEFVETADDRAAFFDDEEFATPVRWVTTDGGVAAFSGIFNAPWSDEPGLATVDMTAAEPTLTCRESDVPTNRHQGDQILIEGVWWTARELRPDETGVVIIDLQRL